MTTAAAEVLYAVAAVVVAAAVVAADTLVQEDSSSSGYVLHWHHYTCSSQIGIESRGIETDVLLKKEQTVLTRTLILHLNSCLSAVGWSAAVFTRSYIL